MDRIPDTAARAALSHRLECIEQGLSDLDGLKAKLLVERIKNLEPNAGTQRGRAADATNATETRTRPSLK